jgi:hypothetical protein
VDEQEREELVGVARGDIPARYAHPIGISVAPDRTEAVVVLGVNEEPFADIEEVDCFREGGRWHAASSSNGRSFGWTPRAWADGEPCLGLLRVVGEAPLDIVTVVVRWDGREHRVPAVGGFFLFAEWDVPEDFDDAAGYPRVVRYLRSDGSSEDVPVDPWDAEMWRFERRHRQRFLEDARARRKSR